MWAVIMAGGKGSRLRPLTCYLPKPMVPILDKPCMEYTIQLLKRHGVTDIAVTCQYLSHAIKNYFGNGHDFGVNLHYFDETEPLGTAGSVRNAAAILTEPFLVVSGDALTDFNLLEATMFHREKAALATLVLTRVEVPLEYGVVMTADDGRILRFLEKPSWGEVFSDTVNTGIYILSPEIFDLIPAGEVCDFGKDVFPLAMKEGRPLFGYVANGYWSDIGNLSQYRQSQFDMLNGRVNLSINGHQVSENVWLGENVHLDAGVQVRGPVFIGNGTTVHERAIIGPYTILGQYNEIESDATIDHSILWSGDFVGRSTNVSGATLCSKVQVGNGVDVLEDSVVGDKTRIANLAVIRPGVKIWPDKTIEEGTIQQSSLIWGNSMFASLFGEDGISGIPNYELVPEMVSLVVAAYGSCLKAGSSVTVSCDENPYSTILKYAAISSLMAIGAKVRDIGVVPVPVVRYEIRRSVANGGVHIRSVGSGDEKRMVVQFFDADGLPIDKATERKVENAFYQEDFARPGQLSLGKIENATEIVRFYMDEVLSRVNVDLIARRHFKIVFYEETTHVPSVMLPILQKMGCNVVMLWKHSDNIGKITRDNNADLGIELTGGGQHIRFYTEKGRQVSVEELLVLQMLIAVKERVPMAVPVTAPAEMEELSELNGIPVVRTKTIMRSLLEVNAATPLQIHYDGFYATASLLNFLVGEQMSLNEVVERLPMFHMHTEVVKCPIRSKGRVMRRLLQEMKGEQLQLIDGIKILTDKGWALILPDSERAQFKIVVQGSSPEALEELTQMYRDKITAFQKAPQEASQDVHQDASGLSTG